MSPLTEPTKLTLAKTYVGIDDPDAASYIALVEAADTAAGSPGGLETATKVAIHSFVKGCKADGIWPAIKASCILAGARTLSGALVPLVGAAPTNPGNVFVQADYNRKTGLVGNGSTKYLNSNRAGNADPQNSNHIAVYASTVVTSNSTQYPNYISSGYGVSTEVDTGFGRLNNNGVIFMRSRQLASGYITRSESSSTGLIGLSRASSASHESRAGAVTQAHSITSGTPLARNYFVFAGNSPSGQPDYFSNARLAFYSIGESLDLARLDARVTDLINAFGAVIP
jgi:hypothetical protein